MSRKISPLGTSVEVVFPGGHGSDLSREILEILASICRHLKGNVVARLGGFHSTRNGHIKIETKQTAGDRRAFRNPKLKVRAGGQVATFFISGAKAGAIEAAIRQAGF